MSEQEHSLEQKIRAELGLGAENVEFNYAETKETVTLDLKTTNPRHQQSFLYHTEKGITKEDALDKMLEYVLKHHQNENTYTVQWMKEGEGHLHTSYFSAKNVYVALDKFFDGKDLAAYKIFGVTLNPIT